MCSDILKMNKTQVGFVGYALCQGGNRRYAAARKYIAFNEVHRMLVAFEFAVRNGNGLQCHQTVGLKQPAAAAKKGIEKLMPYGLDHFN